MAEEKYYATVRWTPEDVLELRPDWTKGQAEKFLQKWENQIANQLVEYGWDVIEDCLALEEAQQKEEKRG